MGENISKLAGGLSGSLLSAVGMTLSINELQAIVSIIFTVLGFIITLITAVIIPLVKKIRKAKKDGVITDEELDDIGDTLKDGLDLINKENKKK